MRFSQRQSNLFLSVSNVLTEYFGYRRSSFDGTSRLWDVRTGDCLRAFSDHKEAIYTLRFSPDGSLFTTGGADGWIFVYDVKVRFHSPVIPNEYVSYHACSSI